MSTYQPVPLGFERRAPSEKIERHASDLQRAVGIPPAVDVRHRHQWVGMLLSTLHLAGLATLTHTPSPMGFLRDLLGRPANELLVHQVVLA